VSELLRVSCPQGRRRYEDVSVLALSVGLGAAFVVVIIGRELASAGITVIGSVSLLAVVGLVGGTILARRGTLDDVVVFEEGRIVFYGPTHADVSWGDLHGYRDGDAEWVELVLTQGAAGHRLLVPTPKEADRVAVLALLDRRGLDRLS